MTEKRAEKLAARFEAYLSGINYDNIEQLKKGLAFVAPASQNSQAEWRKRANTEEDGLFRLGAYIFVKPVRKMQGGSFAEIFDRFEAFAPEILAAVDDMLTFAEKHLESPVELHTGAATEIEEGYAAFMFSFIAPMRANTNAEELHEKGVL
jgi:hypothetical protein